MPRPSEHQDCEKQIQKYKNQSSPITNHVGIIFRHPKRYTQYLLFVSFASLFKIQNPATLPWHAMTYETAVPTASKFDQFATNDQTVRQYVAFIFWLFFVRVSQLGQIACLPAKFRKLSPRVIVKLWSVA